MVACWLKKTAIGAALAAPLAAVQPVNAQTAVGLELLLLVDVSGSIDSNEFNLQMTGYANAFSSPVVQAAIAQHAGGIAVTMVQWSGASQQLQIAGGTLVATHPIVGVTVTNTTSGWYHIVGANGAGQFATAISNFARAFSGGTEPDDAIGFAYPLFASNPFDGARQVIDVSGDGTGSATDTQAARNAALGAGVDAINGLAIGDASIASFFEASIQGGTNSFTIPVDAFADFGNAVEVKLALEIAGSTPNPEPEAVALFGLGLTGLVLLRRRRKT